MLVWKRWHREESACAIDILYDSWDSRRIYLGWMMRGRALTAAIWHRHLDRSYDTKYTSPVRGYLCEVDESWETNLRSRSSTTNQEYSMLRKCLTSSTSRFLMHQCHNLIPSLVELSKMQDAGQGRQQPCMLGCARLLFGLLEQADKTSIPMCNISRVGTLAQ
jgi:hypothetical protein